MDALLYGLAVFCGVSAAFSLLGVLHYVIEKLYERRPRPMATPVADPRDSIARFRRIHTH